MATTKLQRQYTGLEIDKATRKAAGGQFKTGSYLLPGDASWRIGTGVLDNSQQLGLVIAPSRGGKFRAHATYNTLTIARCTWQGTAHWPTPDLSAVNTAIVALTKALLAALNA